MGAKHLFLAATLVVALLALSSDPSPPPVDRLSDAGRADGPVEIVCMVMEVQERENGWTLTLVDDQGIQAQAYLSSSKAREPPEVGQVIRFTLAPSDRDGFFFVEGVIGL